MPYIVPPDETPQYDQFGRRINLYPPVPAPAQPVPAKVIPPIPNVPDTSAPAIAPVATPAPATAQATPITPDFSPITPPVIPPTALEQRAENVPAMPDPRDPRYHQSRLRTALNAIAAGLAGAAGGPKAGLETAESLRYGPYERDVARIKQQQELLKFPLESEQKRREAAQKEVTEGVQRGTAQSVAAKREADIAKDLENERIKREQLTLAQNKQKALERNRVDRLELERLIAGEKDPVKQAQWIAATDIEDPGERAAVHEERLKMWQDRQTGLRTAPKTTQQLEDEAKARAKGTIAGQVEELSKPGVPETLAKKPGAATTATTTAKDIEAASERGTEATEAQSAARQRGVYKEQAKLATPADKDQYKKLAETDPNTAAEFLKNFPLGARSEIIKSGISKKLGARETERLSNANITLGHVNNARQMARDPDIVNNLGPLKGRIAIIKGLVGEGDSLNYEDALKDMPPTVAAKMGEFLNYLNYMVIFESASLSGTRPAQRLIEELRTTGPRASMSQDRLLGALTAIEKSINVVKSSIKAPPFAPPSGATGTAQSTNPNDDIDLSKMNIRKK